MSFFGLIRRNMIDKLGTLSQEVFERSHQRFPVELWFDEEGWLQGDGTWKIEYQPLRSLFWKGMHPVIQEKYDGRLIGIITHYTALGEGRKTARRFLEHDAARVAGKPHRSVSTHFIVDRDGTIIQLASINDRTWHAARKGLSFKVPATRGQPDRIASNPNHWFVGLDLANWGKLKNKAGTAHTWTDEVFRGPIFGGAKGTMWEDYPQVQVEAYVALNEALVHELEIPRSCQFGHEDIDPTNKIDPGPALRLPELLDRIHSSSPTFADDSPDAAYFLERKGAEMEA